MKNVAKNFVNLIMWLFTVVCIWCFIMHDGIWYKLASAVAVIIACPLVNGFLLKRICDRYKIFIRIFLCIIALLINLILIIISPVSIDEERAVKATVDVLEERYATYQRINVKDYDMVVGKEVEGIQAIDVTLYFDAEKNGEMYKLSEKITIYFDTTTGKYSAGKGE